MGTWYPHFWGEHNRSKAMVFLILAQKLIEGDTKYYPTLEISKIAGVPRSTAYNSMGKWVTWGYMLVNRQYLHCLLYPDRVKSRNVYRLSAKGFKYTSGIPKHKRQEYWERIQQFRTL